MSTNEPMTQERLDAIRPRLDCGTPTTEDVSNLITEVERLRALTTVDEDMVERAARESYGPQRWDRILSEWPILAPVKLAAHRAMTRAVLNAALNPGVGS